MPDTSQLGKPSAPVTSRPQRICAWLKDHRLLIGCFIALTVWSTPIWIYQYRATDHDVLPHWAHFAELFVPVHALAEALVIAFLYVELSHLREDIVAQHNRAAVERFQGMFFPYLGALNQFVGSLRAGRDHGRECLRKWRLKLEQIRDAGTSTNQCFGKLLSLQGNDVEPYCLHVENLLTMVNDSMLAKKELERYVDIVRAQLSPDGQIVLLYFCAAPEGSRLLARGVLRQFIGATGPAEPDKPAVSQEELLRKLDQLLKAA